MKKSNLYIDALFALDQINEYVVKQNSSMNGALDRDNVRSLTISFVDTPSVTPKTQIHERADFVTYGSPNDECSIYPGDNILLAGFTLTHHHSSDRKYSLHIFLYEL